MKKLAVFTSAALIVLLTASALSGCSFIRKGIEEADPAPAVSDIDDIPFEEEELPEEPEVYVRPAEWVDVQWETYNDLYFTIMLPAGWKVQRYGDANQMQWIATSPDESIGISNLDHGYAVKDPSMKATLGFDMALANGTVQEFFETTYAQTAEYFSVQNSCVPANKDLLQSIRPYTAIRDYQSLYAQFQQNGMEGEGIYSAVVMDSPDVIVRGYNYGVWEITCIFTEWAPLGELVSWLPVLNTIAKSFAYTDYYLNEWRSIAQEATSPVSTVNDPDPVMEAFEERSRSDTIIQEKRSDMIGEYERVYDNETGNIYRAYNGFLDDIGDQSRYSQITDSQYTEGYVGWIDKY